MEKKDRPLFRYIGHIEEINFYEFYEVSREERQVLGEFAKSFFDTECQRGKADFCTVFG